ncbi:mitochondrial ribosomal protein subunit L37 [Venturia nashicola]|nr:mitochondrial ribosomal protein subunit L37 [Venturia nashicola]
MICRRCLSRLARSSKISPPPRRYLSQSTSSSSPATAQPSKATEPFTTPIAITPVGHGLKPNDPSKKTDSPTVLSSVPAGTPLKGLNFLKAKMDPVAMEDSEYPAWLWDILKPKTKAEDENLATDLYSKSKAKRTAAKKALKAGKLDLAATQKIPIYEQSLDLPTGDGTPEGAIEAAKARKELTKAMREKRRSSIKESNFLKTMS